MRIFLLFIIFSITSFQIAKAEDLYMLNAPLAWGDHRDKEICKKIIDTGGINCDLVEIGTNFKTNLFATYFRAIGTKNSINKFLGTDFAPFPLKTGGKNTEDLFSGGAKEISIRSNGCAVVKVKEGCTCTDGGIGGPIITCSGDVLTNPWKIPDLGINIRDFIPPLPSNGSIIKLSNQFTQKVQPQPISSKRVQKINQCGVTLIGCTCMDGYFLCKDGSVRTIP